MYTLGRVVFLLSVAMAPIAALAQSGGCQPSDIGVDKLKGRVERDYIYIVGRLMNNCAQATGVQIKVTIYDKAGDILTVDDSWPASINNIPARSDFPFETMIRRVHGFAKYDVRVIATKTWRR